MADLLGNDIGLNYKGLLNLDTTINIPLDGTLRVVTDGEGDSSPLYLSTTAIGLGTTSIWDNTNGMLGIGTSSPTQKLEVKSTTAGFTMLGKFSNSDGAGLYIGSLSATYGGIWSGTVTPDATNYSFIARDTNTFLKAAGAIYFSSLGGSEIMYLSSVFNCNLKSGFNNASPTAQLDIVAASATVGLYVKGAASTDIARFYDSAGTLKAYIDSTGQLSIPGAGILSGGGVKDNNNSWGVAWANSHTWGMRGDTGLIGFGSGSNGAGSLDTAISRNAAGVLEVNNGTKGTLTSINVASYKVNGNAGFTGTGIFTSFTIEGGIITAAS